MSDHFLQQINDAVKAKLTGLATTGANVFDDDDYARAATQLPCLRVRVGDVSRERKGTVNAGGGVQRIEAENAVVVTITAITQTATGLRAALWLMAKEIETRWLGTIADRQLDGLVRDARLVAISEPHADTGADAPAGEIDLQFEVKCRAYEGAPDLT